MLVTYRRVTHCMGSWKWGYPKGERHAIVEYKAHKCKNGNWVWKSQGEVCDGITAGNEDYYRRSFPVAFLHTVGSIHNESIDVLDQLEKLPGGVTLDRMDKLFYYVINDLSFMEYRKLRLETCRDEKTGKRYGRAKKRLGRAIKIGHCTGKYQIWAVWA